MEYKKAKNKETEDIYYVLPNSMSRFVEGEEYIQVRKLPDDTLPISYLKRTALVFFWKGMN